MEEHEQAEDLPSRLAEIPKVFYSDLTGKPIEKCVSCERDLLHSNEPYVIEKAFRRYSEYEFENTIFEYAMCMPCAQKMHKSMSTESLQKIQNYFASVDLMERGRSLWETYGNDHEAWIDKCIIKSSDKRGLEEYQVCGQFIGNKIVYDTLPYMLGFEAANEISELLSQKTLDEYDRFIDDYFGLPPDVRKAIKDSPSVLA